MDLVHRVAHILGVTQSTSKKVRHRFDRLLEEIRQKHKRTHDVLEQSALKHMVKTSGIFRRGLFACYNHPDLPRTNNEHEGMFREVRRYERRITGHKSTARRTARDGTLLATAQQRLAGGPISSIDLERMATPGWRDRLKQHQQQRRHYDRHRKLRKNFSNVLKAIRQRIRKLRRPPTRAP
jgi:hypothetical protein